MFLESKNPGNFVSRNAFGPLWYVYRVQKIQVHTFVSRNAFAQLW